MALSKVRMASERGPSGEESDIMGMSENEIGIIEDRLLTIDKIPKWQRENEYLRSGYRPTSPSLSSSVLSIFHWHNETINIDSHTFGAVVFALFPFHFLHRVYTLNEHAKSADIVLFMLYFFCVSTCFVCFVSCHIIWNHSPAWARKGYQLDYFGIVLLMWSASIASIYYGFFCDASIRNFYGLLISAMAGACITFTIHPRFSSPTFRTSRAMIYAGLGLSALVFIAHGILLHGLDIQMKRMSLDWMLLMGSLNIVGAAFYAARIPERWYPCTFDFVGASHQIFHVIILLAGIVHYAGLVSAFGEVRQQKDVCIG
ncbi:mPR-typeG-protein-coupled receptor [Lophium mytilinum]|uniref:MPR-typeG-protein-coupled receptor n=1 Tax=Lophium mytilinum TaxID=390894 RepID=A0A6A6QYI4_9PEZI|nr:mPR-typeG-protein-coupled receptor [Lophium mytilinum]